MTDHDRMARRASSESEIASPADIAAFQDAVLRLLERHAGLYTMGDSTSLPTHAAAELLRSVCFVLGIDPMEPRIPTSLLGVDLEHEFRRRLAVVEAKVEAAGRLWRDVSVAMPLIPNTALRDTLVATGDFFKHYDVRAMAHDIPCSIDYPLCHPVETSLLGVDYVAEYLRRLMVEARFLRHFGTVAVERVLANASPDPGGLLVNLYEPVAVDAIGLALLGRDPSELRVNDAAREAIADRLRPLGASARERALIEAANTACDALGVSGEDEREYLRAIVPEMLPRIEIGLEHGALRGVFA